MHGPSKIKAGHVPVKGLLHLFDENLSKLVNSNSGRGMRVEGDDIILLTSTLTPPPHMDGIITRVAIQNGKIVQYFDARKTSCRAHTAISPAVRIFITAVEFYALER